jgi:AcrR family transcriptional regulator
VSRTAAVTPNSRGRRSRELVLDAAERVMSERGYEASTIGRVVSEAGIPLSSVYHYFGSKDGVLFAVLERGAQRFFDDLPALGTCVGSAAEHLEVAIATAAKTLERHPDFLRLLLVFALQPGSSSNPDVASVVINVRELALERLRAEIAVAFGEDPRETGIGYLAQFALAMFDGAFVAARADGSFSLEELLSGLPAALVAVHDAMAS